MKVYLYENETVPMEQYQDLLDLYHKQLSKSVDYQEEIVYLQNEIAKLEKHVEEVEEAVDICLNYQSSVV
jgi:hypothetical protein